MSNPRKRNIRSLSSTEVERYSRHLALPEVGLDGQQALKSASVLLVGAGGLGAPAGLYLAAAGIGRLGLVDFDRVDVTNLQRQIAFGARDVGRAKVEAARERLGDLNADIDIIAHDVRIGADNARDLMAPYEIVVDGSDNFATRYLVNDTAVALGKPVVFGSVYRFDGQATVFGLEGGPCYRCLFPTPPAAGSVPSCEEGGVLGVVPGVIGSILATETLKIVLGRGSTLSGRLLLFDALQMAFREIQVARNRECPACGDVPTAGSPAHYAASCGGAEATAAPEITASEVHRRMESPEAPQLIDVRERYESEIVTIGGILIPLAQLPDRIDELDRSRDTVVYCRTGIRSAAAVKFLQDAGFERVRSLRGGLYAWSDEVDASVVKY